MAVYATVEKVVAVCGDVVPQVAILGPAQAPERRGQALMPVVNT